MSIGGMDWSRRNPNGAVAHPNNQQYLPQSTSSTVPTMPSHTACVPPNSYSPAQTFDTNSGNNSLLKCLLGANSDEEMLKIQMSVLSKQPMQQTTQVSPGQYNSSYSPLRKSTTATNNQSNVQNPVVSNYQTLVYPNSALQTLQQAQTMPIVLQQAQAMPIVLQQAQAMPIVQQQAQAMPIVQQQAQAMPTVQQQAQAMPTVQQQAQAMPTVQQQAQAMPTVQQQAQAVPIVQQQAQAVQCYGANKYNTREAQQLLQSKQSGGYSHKRAYLQMPNSYAAKRHSRNAQINYQQIMAKTNSYVASYKALNDKNVTTSTSNYQNGQNIQNPMGSNYQTNTLQQQQDLSNYLQSPQRQMPSLHGGFANSSSNVLLSPAVGQMPPSYSQSNTNTSNVYNVSVNQSVSNPNQNFVAQDAQQPVQPYTAPQDLHSVAVLPPAYGVNVPQEQKSNPREILALLKVYQKVRQKYLLLNRENNLLRQKMQSSSQGNSGSSDVRPPLISSLPNWTTTNDPMGRQEVSQNSMVQIGPPSNTALVQTPTLYNNSLNVPVQNIAQSSNSFPSHGYPTNNGDVLYPRNYTAFGSRSDSSGQVVGSETSRDRDPQETSMVSVQANNQYLSSGHSNIGNLSQDGLHITSVQSVAQTTASSESSNPVHRTNASNFYANKPLTSSSREAIRASLPLWKSVPQCPAQNTSGYSEPKQMVYNRPDTVNLLEEIAFSSINEPTAVTLTHKSEYTGPNASKGIEPQIAIVSPLVQIKGLVNAIKQGPKVVPQGEDLANNGVNGVEENDCFNKLHLALESVDAAATMNNLEAVQPRGSIAPSSPCTVKVSSHCNIDQNSTENIESIDDNLQISGICTLVEGNSFYDSSVAMMFDGSTMAKTDTKDDHTLQCSQGDVRICGTTQTTSSVTPITEMVAVKPESQGEIEPRVNIKDDPQGTDVHCLEIQPEQNLSASDVFNLKSSTTFDQLSELLTEFPFGIKNYMSENKLKSPEVSVGKITEKPEIPKSSVPFACDGDESIKNKHSEYAMDNLTKDRESQRTEGPDQPSVVERVPTDAVTSEQLEEDGFEICDSPNANIHITLLDQDQIPKLFPEEPAKSIAHREESLGESSVKESGAPVVDVSVKEESENETALVPDKELFCCLFSWLTHTNGNAPKCNCKLTELGETEDLTNNLSQQAAVIKTEPLTDGLKPSTDSFPDPCKTELKINNEGLPQVIKHPKIVPIDIPLESKYGPHTMNRGPQEEFKAKFDSSEKKDLKDHSRKELRRSDTVANEKILQSKCRSVDPNSKKTTDPLLGHKSKDDGQRRSEKLLVKTDFLKNKHLLKMKKKSKEKTSRVDEGGARNVQKINKNTEVGESEKTLCMDRLFGGKANHEKCKPPASAAQQSEGRKSKSPSSSDRLHSRSQVPSLGKRRGRVKSRPESHFEKVKKVPTVQEYLDRKRELCNKRSGPKVDQRDDPAEVSYRVVEKPSRERSENNLLANLRPLSPAKTNVKTKNLESEAIYQAQKCQPRTSGAYESLHKNHRGPPGSHGKGSLVKKGFDQKITSGKEKIYLSPCDGSRRASYEGINLTKLQICCSPEKPGYFERRKSLDSSVHSKASKSETKNKEAPKMLEFKLCPEFFYRSPTTQERKGELKAVKEKSVVEGIKSKKEAWCSSVPVKKSRVNSSSEDQGRRSPSLSTSSSKSTQKNSSRSVQDSQTTFNVFKQMYHEKRSKSLDGSL